MKTKDITVLKVLQITADKLGVDQNKLTYNTSFSDDLGADSLDVYELIVSIEKEFKIDIGDEHAEKITTIGKLVDYITNKLTKKVQSTEQYNEAIVASKFKDEIISKNLLPSPENN
jgi:acyl carrier protein